MSGLPVEGSVYNIVNISGKNLGASVATNDGKTVCGEPVTTAGYYQKVRRSVLGSLSCHADLPLCVVDGDLHEQDHIRVLYHRG
jgi:hypothetical protein